MAIKTNNVGRPKGLNAYGESTKPMRIPLSKIPQVLALIKNSAGYKLPLYSSKVSAGFPSPADDYIETKLDLNEFLIQHPSSTFIVKASGDSMIGASIQSGDLLIVDKSIEPTHGKIVIASLNGELTVKRLQKQGGKTQLVAENTSYSPIDITENMDMVIWGVVTHIIHEAR
ncbi:SOS (error prone) mutagenesis protein UmuD (RumA) (plasmid) [Legionella adelaidensis]|uniref:LexA repressor n=1 Tax=Legionella adelaidensis TaxID=45056 RepID=A0A0W0R0S0_9GAMM|nr:translesion error-prone DNA polymerase V autoproteolytic subunit [Legionella adelaidensis]KTC64537.1 LexA repressor [Legionella adelaidensis]VEH85904.1 SOS (error prone) mutagenesis protein UmuD (RumA) [Legionella adelaidensis]